MSEVLKQEENRQLPTPERTRNGATYVPRFDILETEDGLTLYGDMPGVEPNDVEVKFENGHLTIHGKVQPRQVDRQLLYGEYGMGDFYREFYVDENIDPGKIDAELKNGVLTLRLPRAEEAKPRRIAVKTA